MHGEIAKAIALSDETTTVTHYRDKDGMEVDLVLERSPDAIVGIEVKARATAHPRDFRGLQRLKETAGDRFACGIVLHDGERIQRTGAGLFAMPSGCSGKPEGRTAPFRRLSGPAYRRFRRDTYPICRRLPRHP